MTNPEAAEPPAAPAEPPADSAPSGAPGYPQPYRAPAGAAYPTPAPPLSPAPNPAATYPQAAPQPYAQPYPQPYAQPYAQPYPQPYAQPYPAVGGPGGLQSAPPAALPQTSGTAVTAFVLALLSFFTVPVVLAVVALVLAARAESEIDAGAGRVGGRGLVGWARGLAVVNLVLVGLLAVFALAVVVGLLVGSH